MLSAPISFLEIVIGYVGAAMTKSLFIGLVILGTAFLFIDLDILRHRSRKKNGILHYATRGTAPGRNYCEVGSFE